MGRPGAVIEVDRNTPPTLFHYGEGVRLEKLPLGSRVIHAPDPMEPIATPSGRSGGRWRTRWRTIR